MRVETTVLVSDTEQMLCKVQVQCTEQGWMVGKLRNNLHIRKEKSLPLTGCMILENTRQ
jgi:hypothetical protein